MSSIFFLVLIIFIVILLGVFYVFGRRGRVRINIETIEYPPFTIKRKNTYSTRYDINTARRVNNSRSYYSLYYKGQLISFPDALDANTGLPGLWKVLILKDAPQAAIIAGSKSVYLITEEDDKYKLKPIIEQNSGFASLQWLDNTHGQPSPKIELYSSDDTDKDCQFFGGQFLHINKRIVLDLKDLSIHSFKVNSKLTNDYYADKVVAFSPDKKSIVYLGHKHEGKYHYALLSYNFKTNQAYTIPFDRTRTRLHEPFALHPTWLSTYFSWEQKEDDSFILEKRKLDISPNWEGQFTEEQSFTISPVRKEMLAIFAAFIKNHLQLSDTDIQVEIDGAYTINVCQSKLKISYFDKIESVYFFGHLLGKNEKSCREIIRKAGDAFNVELRSGAHQSLFTYY